MKFPYVELESQIFAPVVRLEIESPLRWIETEAYVDSGATYSIFKPDVAEILKLNYLKGHRTLLTVGDGGLIPVYLHNLKVKFAGHIFNAKIGFSDKLGVEFNLLGRHSFFEKFIICFNDKNKVLSATWIG